LLSTTIIESGIDIGSTNSIVINNAHLFGLSQLYQLRGRVGRSGIQAFAWFLIPKKHSLSPDGIKRLKAIVKHSALGVGYQVSLADLDLRGSGSLFGYQQSGDGGVGFEYYTKLLSLAIIKLKIKKDFTGDCFIDLLNKPIPSSFIANADERAYYYKAIFSAPSKKELLKIKQDVVALFGFCCPEVDVLFKSRELALRASIKHINKIVKKEEIITVSFDYKKAFPLIGDLLGFIEKFFLSHSLDFWFVNSHKNIIFKYKNKTKDDYILLSSFLKKLTLFK
jgi:transcription-repair coupling factor (superfamily II helicase)